jgi:hypothetical protein
MQMAIPSWIKQSVISCMITILSLVWVLNVNALHLDPNSIKHMVFGHQWDKGSTSIRVAAGCGGSEVLTVATTKST